jgi:adenosylhomocysteine nucleosidase
MPEEVQGFLLGSAGHGTDAAGFTTIGIGGAEAVIASSGLGKVQAAMTATRMLERWHCSCLVSAGTAGGLADVRPMQVVVGTELIQHDYGRSRGHGQLELYRPGVPPLPAYLSTNVALRLPEATRRRFEAAALPLDFVRFGAVASGDTFVNDAATRQRLIDLGAIAVDMECAAVAQVAEYHGLPWLVAKGISDNAAGESHNDFLAGLIAAAELSAAAVAALLPAITD